MFYKCTETRRLCYYCNHRNPLFLIIQAKYSACKHLTDLGYPQGRIERLFFFAYARPCRVDALLARTIERGNNTIIKTCTQATPDCPANHTSHCVGRP